MSGVMTVVAGVFFVTALFTALRTARREAEDERFLWQDLADRLGLERVTTQASLGLSLFSLQGARDGVALIVDSFTETDRDDDSNTRTRRYTRVVALNEGLWGLTMDVYAEHLFSGIGKMLGIQDISTGDETFDGMFVVKADDEDRARRRLTPEVRAVLVALGEGACVRCEPGEVRILWPGFERDAATLDKLLQVATGLARDLESDEGEESDGIPEPPRGPGARKRHPRRRH